MGFEYKIIAKFTKKQLSEIQDLLEINEEFEKKYVFDYKMFWDFRSANNTGQLPNISISFEKDGIYICRYSDCYVWENLQELQEYIECKNIKYTVLDYQE